LEATKKDFRPTIANNLPKETQKKSVCQKNFPKQRLPCQANDLPKKSVWNKKKKKTLSDKNENNFVFDKQ
jgi:hypothetical protein